MEVGCWRPAAPCQQGAREESERRDWLPWPPLWRRVQPVSGIGEEGPRLEGLGEKNMLSMEPRGQQYLRNSVRQARGRAGVDSKKAASPKHRGLHSGEIGTPHQHGMVGRSHPAQHMKLEAVYECRQHHRDTRGLTVWGKALSGYGRDS